jgi:hypothetical protein
MDLRMCQRIDRLKCLSLLLVLLFLSGCGENIKGRLSDFKDASLERVKVMLVDVPLVGRWVKLHPKPSSLYQEVEEAISALKAKGVEKYLPDEFAKFEKEWQEAKKLYSERLYLQAEKKLKNLAKKAKVLNEKLDKTLSALRSSALQKYKEKEAELTSRLSSMNEENKLKLKVYLFYLKSLIEQGRFEEFERELKKDPFRKG